MNYERPLFEVDSERLFKSSWFILGHESEFKSPRSEKSLNIFRQTHRIFRSGDTIRSSSAEEPQLQIHNFYGFLFGCLNPDLRFDDFFGLSEAEALWSKIESNWRSLSNSHSSDLKASWDVFVEGHIDHEHINIVHKNFGDLMGRPRSYSHSKNVVSIEYDPTTSSMNTTALLMKLLSSQKSKPIFETIFFPSSFVEFYRELAIYYTYLPQAEKGRASLHVGLLMHDDCKVIRGSLLKRIFQYIQYQGFAEDESIASRVELGRKSNLIVGENFTNEDLGISYFRQSIREIMKI